MLPSRKTVFTAATAALALAAFAATTLHASRSHAASDAAAGFPSKPVRIIVPVAAGGSADKLTRTLADRLGALWGQSVICLLYTSPSPRD